MDAHSLRKHLRKGRSTLTSSQRQNKNASIVKYLEQLTLLKQASSVAAYLSYGPEPDIGLTIEKIVADQKSCYLPCICENKTLVFKEYLGSHRLTPNTFGILEPLDNHCSINASQLDIVLMPLVGFDPYGNRLGMGGGYYDRTFAFKHSTLTFRKPFLLGVSYALQEVSALHTNHWDIPLDGVVTEDGIKMFERR